MQSQRPASGEGEAGRRNSSSSREAATSSSRRQQPTLYIDCALLSSNAKRPLLSCSSSPPGTFGVPRVYIGRLAFLCLLLLLLAHLPSRQPQTQGQEQQLPHPC